MDRFIENVARQADRLALPFVQHRHAPINAHQASAGAADGEGGEGDEPLDEGAVAQALADRCCNVTRANRCIRSCRTRACQNECLERHCWNC